VINCRVIKCPYTVFSNYKGENSVDNMVSAVSVYSGMHLSLSLSGCILIMLRLRKLQAWLTISCIRPPLSAH